MKTNAPKITKQSDIQKLDLKTVMIIFNFVK